MKRILCASALLLAASNATAGNLTPVEVEPEITPIVIEEQTSSGDQSWIVPLLALLFVAAGST